MTPPARPTASLAPVWSGCQCVLIRVWMRLAPVAILTDASSASAFAAPPPSIIKAPSGPESAITLPPAPWNSVAPPRSVVVMRPLCASTEYPAEAGLHGSSAPPRHATPVCRNRRLETRFRHTETPTHRDPIDILSASVCRKDRYGLGTTRRRRVLIDRLVDG